MTPRAGCSGRCVYLPRRTKMASSAGISHNSELRGVFNADEGRDCVSILSVFFHRIYLAKRINLNFAMKSGS